MNQQAEDSITGMLNCFPQTNQNYELLLASLDKLCAGMAEQAIIEAAERYAAGDVADQSKKFAPSVPEFIEEVRRRQEFIELRNRPRIEAPKYRPGKLAPFEVKRQKALGTYGHLPIIAENVSNDEWRKMSQMKQVPVGAIWVAALATIYGPEPKQAAA